ncbi:MAG: hypothetical protein HC877_00155 [Thioploca sp.]|nr:hypothetical protein [Thioploca sp.]
MLKMIIILITLLFSIPSWGEESSYLEGISILGEKRIAYISLSGGKISVTEGDEITINEGKAKGTWQVVLIKQDSVLFKTKAGSTAELRLDHRSPLPTPSEPSTAHSAKPLVAPEGESSNEEIPPVTPPEDIVQAPEAAIQAEERDSQESLPTELASTTVDTSTQPPPEPEEIPPGHQLVKTPFGTFMINRKEE